MTREDALGLLRAAGLPDAATDVRRLWDYASTYEDAEARFAQAVQNRLDRMPVAKIIGRRAFWKSEFLVSTGVLDPRPDTETLIELAVAEPFTKVLDLGTGSGCIVVSLLLERPDARGVATDISVEAMRVAGENAALQGVADRLVLPLSDWFEDVGGRFDLIVSNPPYIALDEMAGLAPEVRDHDPREALTDEADGLTAYRIIARHAPDHLKPNGRVLVEIGPTQGAAVSGFFRDAGLEDVTVHPDLDGRDRVVAARVAQ